MDNLIHLCRLSCTDISSRDEWFSTVGTSALLGDAVVVGVGVAAMSCDDEGHLFVGGLRIIE